jgi:hypothetical protein
VPALVERLRATGLAARGRAPAIAWNANAAWTPAMIEELRAHFAYMSVDMPPAERTLSLDELIQRYAVSGERAAVVARLAALRQQVQPELLVFDADDYSVAFLEQAAAVAMDAGLARS